MPKKAHDACILHEEKKLPEIWEAWMMAKKVSRVASLVN